MVFPVECVKVNPKVWEIFSPSSSVELVLVIVTWGSVTE